MIAVGNKCKVIRNELRAEDDETGIPFHHFPIGSSVYVMQIDYEKSNCICSGLSKAGKPLYQWVHFEHLQEVEQ